MAKTIDQVGKWEKGGRASASDFNAVVRTVRGMRGAMVEAGFMDSTGLHTRPLPVQGDAKNGTEVGGSLEGSETADETTWDREAQEPGALGIVVPVMTRIVYNHDGDQTLYAFFRDWTIDYLGQLVSISAETRVEVDTPVEGCVAT